MKNSINDHSTTSTTTTTTTTKAILQMIYLTKALELTMSSSNTIQVAVFLTATSNQINLKLLLLPLYPT